MSKTIKAISPIAMKAAATLMALGAVMQPASMVAGATPPAGSESRVDSVAPSMIVAQNSGGPSASLPNGAASINETYGDWTVACSIVDDEKVCVFSQTQGNNQTGQRVFAIELRPPADGKTEGMLLLPFGLKLDDGVKLKIDEQNLGQGARFSTCVPAGCLVPLSFPTVATDALKKGEKLIVNATRSGGGEPPVFTIPLNGFTAAFNRTVELEK